MRTTLQVRITTIIIVFTLALVAAFTIVQLQNQLRTITIFNSLKAKLSVQALKDSIQNKLRGVRTEDHQAPLLASLESLKTAGLIDSATIYTLGSSVIASTNPASIGKKAFKGDFVKIQEAKLCELQKDKQYCTYVYKGTRTLQLFFPISIDGQLLYIAKTNFLLGNMAEAMKQVYIPVIIIAVIVIAGMLFFGTLLSRKVIGPISLLNTASKEMAAGDLSLRIHMDTNDELQELADTFNVMAVELKKMKAKAENANPLTKLPGNIVIQQETESRIKNNEKFIVIYSDLDNFKAFNDKYGIYKGDAAIELAASILKEAVAQKGNPEDFLGHEGGDDFLILSTPDKAGAMGKYITTEFDSRIRVLFDKVDLERGYIEASVRHGDQVVKFPIMTISLAGVTNETRLFKSYGEVTSVAAEMKKKAKATPGSCLVVDKRTIPWPPGTPRPK